MLFLGTLAVYFRDSLFGAGQGSGLFAKRVSSQFFSFWVTGPGGEGKEQASIEASG